MPRNILPRILPRKTREIALVTIPERAEEAISSEAKFFCGLLKLHHGQHPEAELKQLAREVPWAKGWPEDSAAFWNAEAFLWNRKIDPKTRDLIQKELSFLRVTGGRMKSKRINERFYTTIRNLDLGCGSYSYLPSVGLDLSEKMLQLNEMCWKKISGDLEQKLPFRREEFDSVTAILVLIYIHNYGLLLKEIVRVLKPAGIFVAVLSAGKINDWQRQKEVNVFSAEKWVPVLERAGFRVDFYQKEKLFFFRCRKKAG